MVIKKIEKITHYKTYYDNATIRIMEESLLFAHLYETIGNEIKENCSGVIMNRSMNCGWHCFQIKVMTKDNDYAELDVKLINGELVITSEYCFVPTYGYLFQSYNLVIDEPEIENLINYVNIFKEKGKGNNKHAPILPKILNKKYKIKKKSRCVCQ